MVRSFPPMDLVGRLDPPEDAILKREEGTLVWREVPERGDPLVIKLYRRRGIATMIRGRLTRFRAEREYRRLRHLVRWGIRCTEPVGWGYGHSPEHGVHELLVMKEVPEAEALDEHVRRVGTATKLDSLFRMIRRMHESGFCHQTLYTQNVLVSRVADPGEEFYLLDVPRSWTFPRSIVGTSMALFDVLDLYVRLREAGLSPGEIPVDAYGLDESDRRWWEAHVQTDPTRKRTRLIRDLRARIRWAAAWGAVWKRRSTPPI